MSRRKPSELLGGARSTVSDQAVTEDPEDIRIKRLLDEISMVDPCLGSRKLAIVFQRALGVLGVPGASLFPDPKWVRAKDAKGAKG